MRWGYAGRMRSEEKKPGFGESGLNLMQAMLAGKIELPPISRTLGFRLQEVSDGRVVFRGAPGEAVTNPMGTVHGGWYGAILDSALGCAVLTKVPDRHAYTTLEYKINIIRPIPLGTEIDAIAETDHVGRSTGVAKGQIVGVEDGRIYATGSTTCIIMPVKG